jgi:hypothetical protein
VQIKARFLNFRSDLNAITVLIQKDEKPARSREDLCNEIARLIIEDKLSLLQLSR